MIMKKLIFCLLLHIFYIDVYAQDMPVVVGVEFGWSRSKCKSVLDKRFNNGEDSYQLNKKELVYYDIGFADETFNYVIFTFQNDGTYTYLSSILFNSRFDLDQAKYAKSQRDRLFNIFSSKYNYRWQGIDDDGFKYYVLGENPKNEKDGLIVISTGKGETNEGQIKLWTTVTYGPISFINVKDEI